ncbi:Gfo/Idh/MocA family oxidoreductase [Chloroflexi bacterium TSY]|nr:Gfo/Idh/MocA family oxidoreductase [Chloroflexi bacterium TSY]
MTNSLVRIGFVGCGRQATASWYPNFATIPELDLTACCDIQADLAERNARFFGAKHWYTKVDAMLDQEDLDAVIVVGPPDMHYTCGKQILEAGLPLMMEKPPARIPAQAEELVELAKAKGVLTQIGHNMRHAPGVRKFKELMATPEFGQLLFVESRYFMPSPMWPETSDYRTGWTYMIFQSTHAVDLARHIGGEITSIYADHSVGAEGRFSIASVASFKSGATGTITLTGCTPNWTCKLEAAGDARAHLRLVDLHTLHFEPHTDESGYGPTPGIPGHYWAPAVRDNAEKRGGYWHQMQAFAHAVQSGKTSVPTLYDAYRAMVICDAMLDSIERKEPIEV